MRACSPTTLLPLLLLATAVQAGPQHETHPFSVASSDSLGETNVAMVVEAGWPRLVAVEYVMGLLDFFDLAVRLDYEYDGPARLGARGMLQFVDLDRVFDLGLALEPMFGMVFGDARTTFDGDVGLWAGVRPIPILTLFVQLWHRSRFEFITGDHRHGPGLVAGLEVGVGSDINLMAYGQIDGYWVDHPPVFGGGLGVAFGFF